MNKLLRFNPEPFEDLAELQGEYDHEVEFAEDEMEEERGRRRPRERVFPSRRGGIPRKVPPRLRRPIIRPPRLPFIPPLWPVFPTPEPPPDVPPGRDVRHAEPPGGAPTGGQPPQPEPSEAPSEYVRWVQSCLNQVRGLQLTIDGIMNTQTRSAIRGFQEHRGLRIDGLVGPETERALVDACKTASPSTPSAPSVDSGPATAVQPGELLWASEAEWASETVSRRPRRTASRPAVSPAASPGAPAVFDSQAFRQQIVRIANQELARWGNGAVKETDPRVRRVLQDYWKTGTGNNYSEAQVGNPAFQNAHPWSAAFISWVMKTAGAGSAFRYSSAHATYTRWAKDNRLANNANPFKAYRITELAPQVGDVVCKRREGSGATYDNIQPDMKTHCDIVTAVRPGSFTAVGGNVNNSVAQKTLRTDAKGFITDPEYFAVIRIGAVGPSTPRVTLPTPTEPVDVKRMTKEQFIEFVGRNARRAMAKTGVSASVTVAQAIIETGWGKHTIGEAKNLFGIKGRGPAGSVRAPTREFINGQWVTVNADFAKYDSFEQSISEHARFFLRNRRYARALQFKTDPDTFAREIHKAGYATAPNYADQLIALMRKYNLYRFDR